MVSDYAGRVRALGLPRIVIGHALDVLARLPERFIHCVVTSPPYWGLRKYPTPPVVWGGEAGCGHEWRDAPKLSNRVNDSGSDDGYTGRQRGETQGRSAERGAYCSRCSAWRGNLGNEPEPAMYVAHLVECFRAVRRVLRDDGVCWLNLGDSYGGGPPGGASHVQDRVKRRDRSLFAAGAVVTGLKPLDMVGIPWAVAVALRADGWILRSDVIWAKMNAMPESMAGWRWERCRVKIRSQAPAVKAGQYAAGSGNRMARPGGCSSDPSSRPDEYNTLWRSCPGCAKCSPHGGYVLRRGAWRPTRAHEYVFLLAKGPEYYCDGDAVKAPVESGASSGNKARKFGEATGLLPGGLGQSVPWVSGGSGANLRSVWTFPSEPLKDAHFAAFPRRLPELCIRAGTSERGCCPRCGAPWARVIENRVVGRREFVGINRGTDDRGVRFRCGSPEKTQMGWRPTCACPPHKPTPCVVLDLFAGSGTTLRVAEDLGRLWLGIDLGDEYLKLMRKRTAQRTIFGMAGRLALENAGGFHENEDG